MIDWIPMKDRLPEPGRSYLILAYRCGPVADVAFYEGIKPGGEHWWILSDVTLDHHLISYWAELDYPEENEDVLRV